MSRFDITLFEVRVRYIYVSKHGQYGFDFELYKNGKRIEYGNLDGTYSQRSREAFRKVLKRGWAARLVLQRYI